MNASLWQFHAWFAEQVKREAIGSGIINADRHNLFSNLQCFTSLFSLNKFFIN